MFEPLQPPAPALVRLAAVLLAIVFVALGLAVAGVSSDDLLNGERYFGAAPVVAPCEPGCG